MEPRTVVDHVAAHAAERPDAPAVSDSRTTLTYGDLDARANRLAHVLRAQGAQTERCVAICVEASADMVLGALAALKAGAAYVPVDPHYPQERIELILDDTDPVAVLVDETTPPEVLAKAAGRAIDVTADPVELDPAGHRADAPAGGPGVTDLAYVVYTSGSTGRPKGVEVEHRSLVNLTHALARDARTSPDDRCSQTASPSFDATVMEIWHPLVAGASLHISPIEVRRDPRRLVQWLADTEITITMVATALVGMLFERDELYRRLQQMRWLSTGGAALLTRPAADTPYPLVNMYGPTETTVVATQGIVPAGGDGPPTIGRPLDGVLIHILDEELQPVPVGEHGEIFIGGVQVARGYRGRPDLTAERFLPDPFNEDDPAGRMYRTGDIGAWTDDGEIAFHGRADDQLEIRGYRIEPQEVEAALTSHPAIVDAVATAAEHGRRGLQLAAYYTATEPAPTSAEIRAHVTAILPFYMVPSSYQRVDAFALTPNGKIDRKQLPASQLRRADLDGEVVPPRTDDEQRAAEIFADVLELDVVGIEDDFFALGGDSLDAVSCVARLGELAGRDVAVPELYAHPTIARLLPAIAGDAATAEIDWEAERDPRLGGIEPVAHAPRGTGGRTVLLTGATGYLGPHLLAELAATTRDEEGEIVVLVRASNPQAGAERLRRALLAERRDISEDWARITVLCGDLAAPRFGLDEAAFDALAARLDAIVHSGAMVHHLHDYERLRAPNVEGTRTALALAKRAGGIPLRYVSSISTALELRDGHLLRRADVRTTPPEGAGYAQTKWVAGQMVIAAAAQGVPTTIARLPRAMGARRSGATSTHDAAVRLLRGCIEVGAYPEWNGWEPWAPVDDLAAAIAHAPFDPPRGDTVMYPPAVVTPYATVFRAAASYGYALERLPLAAWQERLRAAGAANPAAAVAAEFGLDDDGASQVYGEPVAGDWGITPRLPGRAVAPVDAEYVWRMLDYLVGVGYLPRPGQAETQQAA